MESEWAFLEPWRAVLTGVLRHEWSRLNVLEERGFQASFDCWRLDRDWGPGQRDATSCTLHVEFPADVASRRESGQLQRVREALEIFDRLAAVDNAAFRRLLSDFAVPDTQEATGRRLPHDPWTCSTEFGEVMQQLERMGLDRTGYTHNTNASNSWKANTEAVMVWGCQETVEIGRRMPTNPFARELNKLFELNVPSVVQLEAVRNRDTMMVAWQQPPQTSGVKALVDEVTIVVGEYSEHGVPEITASLARKDMTTFHLTLQDFEQDEDQTFVTVNAGFFFSTMACGRAVCKLQGEDSDFPAIERTGKCHTWDVEYSRASSRRFGAMFSAIAESSTIDDLKVSTDDDHAIYPDPVYWSWLAYCFWSKASISSVKKLEISLINLTEQHVAAVEQVLNTGYPVAGADLVHAQFGYVTIPHDTEVCPLQPITAHDAPLVLLSDHRCRAYYDSSYMGKQVDAIVPGYGISRVKLADGATQFIPDKIQMQQQQTVSTSCDVSSLSLRFSDVDNNTVVPKLLRLIRERLRSLSIDLAFIDEQVELDLSKVVEACQELEALKIVGGNVLIPFQDEMIQNCGLKKLVLHESNQVDNLESYLSDRSVRMARELVELDIAPASDVHFTPDYAKSLRAHNGEVLPITKTKLPLSCRLAMISVVTSQDRPNADPTILHAVYYLDASILSMIFAFAGVPEQRLVKVAV